MDHQQKVEVMSDDELSFLKKLSPAHEEILLATRELQPPTYKGLAEYLGAPLGTVKSRLSRARAQLKKLKRQADAIAAVTGDQNGSCR